MSSKSEAAEKKSDAANVTPDEPSEDVSSGVDPTSLFKNKADINKTRETQLLDVINGVMSTEGMNVKTVLEDKHIVAIARCFLSYRTG